MAPEVDTGPVYRVGEVCRCVANDGIEYRFVDIYIPGQRGGVKKQTLMLPSNEAHKLVNCMSHK